MVYTVTFSPALDYVVRVKQFRSGRVNRTEGERINCGGKGINVSIVLKNLGIDSVALGFIAGFTGDEIKKRLTKKGIKTDFVRADGMSRINIKLKSEEETDINGQGALISQKNLDTLFLKLRNIENNSALVLAGAIPNGLPSDIYEQIMRVLEGKNIMVVVDATNDLLRNTLKFRPFLIKPNATELGELFGKQLNSDVEIEACALKLQSEGARNVIVSMAGDGALMVDENGKTHRIAAPSGKVIDSVGAGDSLVAGFLAGIINGMNAENAFKYGVATGSASAFSEELATKNDVDIIYLSF